jgi:hypothetical protein
MSKITSIRAKAVLGMSAALCVASPAMAQRADRSIEIYHIFDLKTSASRAEVTRAITDSLNANVTDSDTVMPLVRGEPPEKPGTFELVDALENSRMGGLAALIPAAQRAQFKQVKCDGAVWIANAVRRIRGSQNLRLTMCLFPYTEGYHLDVYAVDTEEKGGGIAAKLGRAIAGAVVKDPRDWTNKTIVGTVRSVSRATGATVTYVEGQPAFEGAPWNDENTLLPQDSEKTPE